MLLYILKNGFNGFWSMWGGVWQAFLEISWFNLAKNQVFFYIAIIISVEVYDRMALPLEFLGA